MFPPTRQRVMILICLLVAAWLCYELAGAIGAGNGAGSSLLFSGSAVGAITQWMLYLLPVLILAVICGAAGNPLSGYAVLAAGLLFFASRGGSINAWIHGIASPGNFTTLALEAALWTLPFITYTLIERYGRRPLRILLPKPLRSQYCAELPSAEPALSQAVLMNAGINLAIAIGLVLFVSRWRDTLTPRFLAITLIAVAFMLVLWVISFLIETAIEHAEHTHRLRAPMAPAFLAGVTTLVIGSAGTFILQVNHVNGQVIGALVIAFTVAAFLAHQTFPTPSRLTIILSPLALAAAGYLYTAMSFETAPSLVLRSFNAFGNGLPAPALAMPAHYAAAGVLGAVLGTGWSQSVFLSREKLVSLVS